MKHISYLLLLICLLSSCFDRIDRRNIKIVNKSDKIIYCLSGFEDSIPKRYLGSEERRFDESYKIEKESYENLYDKSRDWDSYIEHYGSLRLFIIVKDSVDKYGWREILIKNKYTKLYKIKIDDLNKNNWQIVYNGK